jgi:hypothetical protein
MVAAGHHNGRDLKAARPQGTDDAKSVQHWHPQVQNQGVGAVALDGEEDLRPVARGLYIETGQSKGSRSGIAEDVVIVSDDHAVSMHDDHPPVSLSIVRRRFATRGNL